MPSRSRGAIATKFALRCCVMFVIHFPIYRFSSTRNAKAVRRGDHLLPVPFRSLEAVTTHTQHSDGGDGGGGLVLVVVVFVVSLNLPHSKRYSMPFLRPTLKCRCRRRRRYRRHTD